MAEETTFTLMQKPMMTKRGQMALGIVSILSIVSLVLFIDARSRVSTSGIDFSIGTLIAMFVVPGISKVFGPAGQWLFIGTALLSLSSQGFAAGEHVEGDESSVVLIAFMCTCFASVIGHLIGDGREKMEEVNVSLSQTMSLVSGFLAAFIIPFLFIENDRFDDYSLPAYIVAVVCAVLYLVQMLVLAYVDLNSYELIFLYMEKPVELKTVMKSMKLIRISLLVIVVGCMSFVSGKTEHQFDVALTGSVITAALSAHYSKPTYY